MLARTRSTRRSGVLPHRLLDRLEQRVVGFRIMEWLAGRVEHRDAAFRQQEAHRTVHQIQPRADPFAEGAVLVARGAHQRDVGIVDDEFAAAEFLRHGVARTEIDHVERAGRADIGQAGADRRAETVGIGGEHAADDHVGDLGRGEVDESPTSRPRIAKVLHRPAADAGGVEHQAVIVGLRAVW